MFGNHFFQKLKGLLVKVGLSLSFEFRLHAVKLSLAWWQDAWLF